MIEARTVAFILIILLIAFIVYRLCLSNERKTKGGFDNLNDVVLAVYDSIKKDTKLEDIDIATVKYEVLKTLNLVLEGSNDTDETLKSAFYDTLNDYEKLAFIEALIHSFYVEGYVPSEFIGCDVAKKQVILKARHNYKYSDIVIYLNDLPNEINDMSKYLNAIKYGTKYKISICNSIKAHSVCDLCRWGVYEYIKGDNRTMDIDYEEGVDALFEHSPIRIPDITKTIYTPNKIYDLFNYSKDLNNTSNNPGLLSMSQQRVADDSNMQVNSISIINPSNGSVRADENIDNNIDNNSKTSAPGQLGVYDADAMQNDSYNKTNSESDNESDNGLAFVELNDLN